LLARNSPWAVFVLSGWIVFNAIIPNLVRVATGVMVGQVPAAASDGLDSPAGHRLVVWFVVATGAFALSLIVGPLFDTLSTAIKTRMTYAMQERLMDAVSGPTGIAHLEDPAVLDRVAMAQGSLTTFMPGDAPCVLARVIGFRLSGFVACMVLASFRWWIGAAFVVYWCWVRCPLRKALMAQIRSFHDGTNILRRAQYFERLATRSDAAKETRVFGLHDWILGQHQVTWLAGIAASWKRRRRVDRTVILAGLGGTVLSLLACGTLGYAALHGEATLSQIGVVLPTVFFAWMVGGWGLYDFQLEWMVSALPNLDGLEADLAAGHRAVGGTRPVSMLPQGDIRFDHVTFRYPRADRPVLDDLDLVIPAGRATAIVGVNGAGKTTLIKLLASLHLPTSGRILVGDVDLAEVRAAEWQRQVAVVSRTSPATPPPCATTSASARSSTSATSRPSPWSPIGPVPPAWWRSSPSGGTPCCRGSSPTGPTSRVDSGSGWRWAGPCTRWSTVRPCWSSTSPPPGSTCGAKPSSSTDSSRSHVG
jgi:ATP-binding cassette subfamily B protein